MIIMGVYFSNNSIERMYLSGEGYHNPCAQIELKNGNRYTIRCTQEEYLHAIYDLEHHPTRGNPYETPVL
jgi:hypothetical protein